MHWLCVLPAVQPFENSIVRRMQCLETSRNSVLVEQLQFARTSTTNISLVGLLVEPETRRVVRQHRHCWGSSTGAAGAEGEGGA